MADPIEQERAAFEAWRRSVTTKISPDDAVARAGFGDDAEYVNRTTRAMWIGWKGHVISAAIRASSEAPT